MGSGDSRSCSFNNTLNAMDNDTVSRGGGRGYDRMCAKFGTTVKSPPRPVIPSIASPEHTVQYLQNLVNAKQMHSNVLELRNQMLLMDDYRVNKNYAKYQEIHKSICISIDKTPRDHVRKILKTIAIPFKFYVEGLISDTGEDAFANYLRARTYNEPYGTYKVALEYYNGNLTGRQDRKLAVKTLTECLEYCAFEAYNLLGMLQFEEKNHIDGIKSFKISAELGNSHAMHNLSEVYYNTYKDNVKYRYWRTRAYLYDFDYDGQLVIDEKKVIEEAYINECRLIDENRKLKREVRELKDENEVLNNKVNFAPDAPGYHATQQNFTESVAKLNKSNKGCISSEYDGIILDDGIADVDLDMWMDIK